MAQRPLKITLAAGPFYPTPPAPTGAVQRAWYDLALRFAGKGHEVTVVACRYPGQAAEETVSGFGNRGRVKIRRRWDLRQGRNIYWDLAKDLFACLRTAHLMPAGDIIITNSFWMPIVARFLCRRSGKVYVSVGRFPKGQMKMYRDSARLHAVSKAIEIAILEEEPTAGPRIRILPYPIATDVFTPPTTPRDYTGSRTILYTGRVHPEKGLHLLVEAFATLHDEDPTLKLRIIGPQRTDEGAGGEEYLSQLRTLTRGKPVEFLPPIYDRQKLAAELQQAHFYCYPSLAEKGESFGVAPLEAMSTGLVPVVSDLACFRDFVVPGENGLVFDHRSKDAVANLVAQFRTLINDRPRMEQMGKVAAVKGAEFSYDSVADRYIADFYSLVGAEAGK